MKTLILDVGNISFYLPEETDLVDDSGTEITREEACESVEFYIALEKRKKAVPLPGKMIEGPKMLTPEGVLMLSMGLASSGVRPDQVHMSMCPLGLEFEVSSYKEVWAKVGKDVLRVFKDFSGGRSRIIVSSKGADNILVYEDVHLTGAETRMDKYENKFELPIDLVGLQDSPGSEEAAPEAPTVEAPRICAEMAEEKRSKKITDDELVDLKIILGLDRDCLDVLAEIEGRFG